MTVEHLTPEAAIARIPDWDGLDVSFETLGGGITNHNYVVTVAWQGDVDLSARRCRWLSSSTST